MEPVLAALLNDLAGLERPALLVLEDYHLIADSRVHAELAFFIAYLPASAHLLLIAREDPPLPLAELRAGGRLAELRFTHAELRAFVEQALPVALSGEALRRVEARTEGAEHTVHLSSNRFVPEATTLRAGASLTLVADTFAPHVIANGTWAPGGPQPGAEPGAPVVEELWIEGNGSGVIGPFPEPGEYQFYCPIHPGMNHAVTVE